MNYFHLFSMSFLLMTSAGLIHPEKTPKPITITTKNLDPVDRKEDHEYIPWVNERKLTWEDYHCPPVTNTDAVASTSTALGMAYQVVNGKLVYHITCGFSKIKSWGLLKTDYILAHEQAHFDITEIYARKLYEALQHYEFNRKSYKNDINAIYRDIVKQKEDLQELYDGETDHSRNHKKQYQWLDKVGKMLQDSEAYSNYP